MGKPCILEEDPSMMTNFEMGQWVTPCSVADIGTIATDVHHNMFPDYHNGGKQSIMCRKWVTLLLEGRNYGFRIPEYKYVF